MNEDPDDVAEMQNSFKGNIFANLKQQTCSFDLKEMN